jgi:alanyl-tRNA synthetase
MTLRLYYTDAYLRDFEAAVVERSADGRRVYLDRTAFYPASGGQPFDTGRLAGTEVVDVVDEGERIAHLLAAPLAGERVLGAIDWPRRFDHMQQHTGQHLLSAVLEELFGLGTVSVHFGAESSTLDLDGPAPAPEHRAAAEARANEGVPENRPFEVSFEDAAGAAGLRRAAAREGSLRVVTIRDLDRSACGGTHVRATGEIGPILLRGAERAKKLTRVKFLCGGRAVRRARADLDLLTRSAGQLSASIDDLPDLIRTRQAELKAATSLHRELEETLDGYRAGELYRSTAPMGSGLRLVVQREERGGIERLRGLGRAVAALPRAVFVGALADPPTLLLAASEDSGVDAGAVLRPELERVGGRGGGNTRLAQGSAPEPALAAVVEALVGRLG